MIHHFNFYEQRSKLVSIQSTLNATFCSCPYVKGKNRQQQYTNKVKIQFLFIKVPKKNFSKRNRFLKMYMCCLLLMLLCLLCAHAGTLHLDTALRSVFISSVVLSCSFLHPCSLWQTTSFHAYCFYAFILLKAMLLIHGFHVYYEEENKT